MLPERFELKYRGSDGADHRPVMIHRALAGSLERFFGVLIEHCAGAFPAWLAPVQAVVAPISEHQLDYAQSVGKRLRDEGFRVDVDDSNEKIGYKIRHAQDAEGAVHPRRRQVGGRGGHGQPQRTRRR